MTREHTTSSSECLTPSVSPRDLGPVRQSLNPQVKYTRFQSSRESRCSSVAERIGLHREHVVEEVLKSANLSRATGITDHSSVDICDLHDYEIRISEIADVIYENTDVDQAIFLLHIHLEPDGGLEKVKELWHVSKLYWCLILFFFCAYNVVFLIMMNSAILRCFVGEVFIEGEELVMEFGYVWQGIRNGPLQQKRYADELASVEMLDMYKMIDDPEMRWSVLQLASVVATIEVVWLLVYVVRACIEFWRFSYIKSECRAYQHIFNLFQETLPRLSTFSAIKLAAHMHHVTLYDNYLDMLRTSSCHSFTGVLLLKLWFGVSRLSVAAMGVAAFLTKMLLIGFKFINPATGTVVRWAYVVSLLHQCMGCILFERLLQDRVFMFTFGGIDCVLQDDERALLFVFKSRLAAQIWQDFWNVGERLKAVCMLASLDHYDLQRLFVTEHGAPMGSRANKRIDLSGRSRQNRRSEIDETELCEIGLSDRP